MKKICTALLLALTLIPAMAMADAYSISGQIKAGQTMTVLAPYSGVVDDFTAEEGDALAAGDALFSIRSTPVYAQYDGVVTGVFAQPGDNAASVQERYGALCYTERDFVYAADCTTTGSDSANENKIVHVGETVYIRSSNNNKRTGVAVVTGVSGKSYTLDVISEQDMRLSEPIKVFRSESRTNASCIGTGHLERIDPSPVTAEGYVLAVHVQNGQQISRGDLLFEIVPDALEGMKGGSSVVSMPADGVLLSIAAASGTQIAKDEPMATYCPQSAMRLVCEVGEDDLPSFAVGDVLQVTLDAYPNEEIKGTIVKIASVGTEQGANDDFNVTIELEDTSLVRIGMNATANR